MKKLDDVGLANNTIIVFSTDNGAENFTWPDGSQTPFAGGKGTALEGGFREFWRFVNVQQEVEKLARTAIEFPPMQKGASFNLEAVKQQITEHMQSGVGK